MAQQLDRDLSEIPGHRRIYPWEDWIGGSVWEVKRGVDFQIRPDTFRDVVHNYASRKGLRVATRVRGDAVEFQFYQPPAGVESTQEETPKLPKPTQPGKYIDHADCGHERTPVARQKCRRERRKNANPEGESQ